MADTGWGVAHISIWILKFPDFGPLLSRAAPYRGSMEDELRRKLEKTGDELRASHDDAVIADVIGEVENLDDDRAAETADLLRTMVGVGEE